VFWCIVGSEEEAASLLAPVHDVGTPLLHGVGPIPHPDLQSLFDGLYTKGLQCYWRADFVNELSDELIEHHLEWAQKLPSMHSTRHLYPIDGAAHDVGNGDTAFSYRDAQWAEVIFGVDPDPANADAIRDWCVGYWDATHPYSAGGAYVNFMMDEGQERVRATYRENYDRPRQGAIRPGQRVPRQPEHPARGHRVGDHERGVRTGAHAAFAFSAPMREDRLFHGHPVDRVSGAAGESLGQTRPSGARSSCPDRPDRSPVLGGARPGSVPARGVPQGGG
jgi:hypothetical protein